MKGFRVATIVAAGLIFASTHGLHQEQRKPVTTCADLNRVSYCSSCFNVTNCDNGVDTSTIECDPSTQACYQDNMGSFCGDLRFVPECDCDVPTGNSKTDFYDPRKYYYCLEEDVVVPGECNFGQLFNPDMNECEDIFLSTPFPPSPTISCPEDELVHIAIDCTRYQDCILGYSEIYECENGDIYNNNTNNCELYIPFTCVDKADGRYPDSVNCTVAQVCEGGVLASTIPCSSGQVFDPESKNCTKNVGACQLSGCFVPIPDYVTCLFGNETYKINHDSYYECYSHADGTFEPVARECSSGFYFDEDNGSCNEYPLHIINTN